MNALIVSMDMGSFPMHQEMAPLLEELGVTFQAVHDQESARALLQKSPPRLVLLDSHVPKRPMAASGGGLSFLKRVFGSSPVGTNVADTFADTLGLAQSIAASKSASFMMIYSCRTGLAKATKVALEALPGFKGYFAYGLTETNRKKVIKIIRSLFPAP